MRLLAAALLFVLLAGCGYHFAGNNDALPGGVKTVYLQMFVNQTAEPQLENQLGNNLSEVFARNPNISQVENLHQAEAVLSGTIRSYSSTAVSYDTNDDINEYRITMTIDAALRQVVDGRLLWQAKLSWNDEYLAEDNKTLQEDLEREASEEISLRLAEQLLSRLSDDF